MIWLYPNERYSTHLCQTGQIHEGEVEYVRAVYAEVDGELADALVLARDAERLLLDLAANLVEVGVALVYVKELAPFGVVGWRVGDGGVDELEDERPTRDNALPPRKEVATDDSVPRSDSKTEIGTDVRTFPAHWTCPQTGCPPAPPSEPQITSAKKENTHHGELGHVQLSAWAHVSGGRERDRAGCTHRGWRRCPAAG